MAVAFQKAPISELICGVVFNGNLLLNNSIIFELLSELAKDYPAVITQPAIFEEEVQGQTVFQNINVDATGFSLYRLISVDRKYIVQLQQNLLLVNWVRNDDQKVGAYPGFSHVFNRFKNIFSLIVQKLSKYTPDIDVSKHIKTFTLHYQDRVFINEYISDLSRINEIVRMKIPEIVNGENHTFPANNIFSKFTVPVKEINGYSIISINTGISRPINQQILVVECRLKGKFDGGTIDDWFDKAHDLQVRFFENFFTEKILTSWKD